MFTALQQARDAKSPRRRRYQTKAERDAWEGEEKQHQAHRTGSVAIGILTPIVAALSLPGLTERWYILEIQGIVLGAAIDPVGTEVLAAFGLAFAILAAFLVLLRTLETHFRFCTFAAMSCLAGNLITTVIALLIFALRHRREDGFTFSSAFYLSTAGAIVAACVLMLFAVDCFWATDRFRTGGSGLSGKQRSLVISFSAFEGLWCISSLINKALNNLTFLNALYFTASSFTAAFGDISPRGNVSRGISLIINTLGIIGFSCIIAFTRVTMLEMLKGIYKEQEKRVLNWWRNSSSSSTPADSNEVVEEEHDSDDAGEKEADKESPSDKGYEEAVVELLAEKSLDSRSEVIVSFSIFLVVWLVGAAVYAKLEHWDYWTGLYFVFSGTLVAYGDLYPSTMGGRSFYLLFTMLSTITLTVVLSVLAEAYSSRFQRTYHRSRISCLMLAICKDSSLKQRINEDREIAQKHKTGDYKEGEGEPAEDDPEEDGATDQGSTRSVRNASDSASVTSTATRLEAKRAKEKELAESLATLVEDAAKQIGELVKSDAQGEGQMVDRIVRQMMKDQGFDRKNKERVMADADLKRFLYLRQLADKFNRLAELARATVADLENLGDETQFEEATDDSPDAKGQKEGAAETLKDQVKSDHADVAAAEGTDDEG